MDGRPQPVAVERNNVSSRPYGHEKSVSSAERSMKALTASMASREATSPALWPPIPSATAKNDDRIRNKGVLVRLPNSTSVRNAAGVYHDRNILQSRPRMGRQFGRPCSYSEDEGRITIKRYSVRGTAAKSLTPFRLSALSDRRCTPDSYGFSRRGGAAGNLPGHPRRPGPLLGPCPSRGCSILGASSSRGPAAS